MLEKHILQSAYYYFVWGNAAKCWVISNIDAGAVCILKSRCWEEYSCSWLGGRGGYTFGGKRFMKNKFIFQTGAAVLFRSLKPDIFAR